MDIVISIVSSASILLLPGILGYGVVCWLMPAKKLSMRMLRALLVLVLTCGFGVVAGFILEPYYAQWHGKVPDGKEFEYHMASIIGMLQLVVGFVLGLLSLSPLSAWFKHDLAVVELVKSQKQDAESAQLLEKKI